MNSGFLVVNYPFDDNNDGIAHYSKTPDDEVFRQVAKAYSQVTWYSYNGLYFRLR